MDNKKNKQEEESLEKKESLAGISFLKVDALKRGSYALSLLLKTDDIIVGVDKKPFRGTQKVLNQILKEKPETVLTISRKNTFFDILARGPLGIKLLETGSDEDIEILTNTKKYLDTVDNYEKYAEFEVYRGKKNIYNIIEVNEGSLFASLFPLVWFYHNKLYIPLFLIILLFLLLGTIAWWLFLASWIILTVYMNKGSMSILRGYCLFNEMRLYFKLYAKQNKDVQLIIRKLDKKSNFIFPSIDPPENNIEKDKRKDGDISLQTS